MALSLFMIIVHWGDEQSLGIPEKPPNWGTWARGGSEMLKEFDISVAWRKPLKGFLRLNET